MIASTKGIDNLKLNIPVSLGDKHDPCVCDYAGRNKTAGVKNIHFIDQENNNEYLKLLIPDKPNSGKSLLSSNSLRCFSDMNQSDQKIGKPQFLKQDENFVNNTGCESVTKKRAYSPASSIMDKVDWNSGKHLSNLNSSRTLSHQNEINCDVKLKTEHQQLVHDLERKRLAQYQQWNTMNSNNGVHDPASIRQSVVDKLEDIHEHSQSICEQVSSELQYYNLYVKPKPEEMLSAHENTKNTLISRDTSVDASTSVVNKDVMPLVNRNSGRHQRQQEEDQSSPQTDDYSLYTEELLEDEQVALLGSDSAVKQEKSTIPRNSPPLESRHPVITSGRSRKPKQPSCTRAKSRRTGLYYFTQSTCPPITQHAQIRSRSCHTRIPGAFAAITCRNEDVHTTCLLDKVLLLKAANERSFCFMTDAKQQYMRFGRPIQIANCDLGHQNGCLNSIRAVHASIESLYSPLIQHSVYQGKEGFDFKKSDIDERPKSCPASSCGQRAYQQYYSEGPCVQYMATRQPESMITANTYLKSNEQERRLNTLDCKSIKNEFPVPTTKAHNPSCLQWPGMPAIDGDVLNEVSLTNVTTSCSHESIDQNTDDVMTQKSDFSSVQCHRTSSSETVRENAERSTDVTLGSHGKILPEPDKLSDQRWLNAQQVKRLNYCQNILTNLAIRDVKFEPRVTNKESLARCLESSGIASQLYVIGAATDRDACHTIPQSFNYSLDGRNRSLTRQPIMASGKEKKWNMYPSDQPAIRTNNKIKLSTMKSSHSGGIKPKSICSRERSESQSSRAKKRRAYSAKARVHSGARKSTDYMGTRPQLYSSVVTVYRYHWIRPPFVMITGKPGCGKSTLAKLLCAQWHCKHLNASAIIATLLNDGSSEGSNIKSVLSQGRELEDQFVFDLLVRTMESPECVTGGYVMDDFPTYSEQTIPIYKQLHLLTTLMTGPQYVVNIEISNRELRQRRRLRRMNIDTGELCTRREDAVIDTLFTNIEEIPEQVEQQLQFHENVFNGEMEYFMRKNPAIRLIQVDGKNSPQANYHIILNHLIRDGLLKRIR